MKDRKLFRNGLLAIAFIGLGGLLIGCAEQDTPPPAIDGDGTLKAMLADFYTGVKAPDNRTRGDFEIVKKTTRHYVITDSEVVESPETRSSDGFSIDWVELDFGDSRGYAVLSTDERLNRVYYFTDNGVPADTARIGGLRDLLNAVPEFAAEEILHPEDLTRAEPPIPVSVSPLVDLCWGQGYPYNFLMPACYCDYCNIEDNKEYARNHQLAGCVTIAVAQTLATLKHKGTYYGSRDIDFDNLPKNT